jgi:hypothetical protein
MRRMGLARWQMAQMMRIIAIPAYTIGRVRPQDVDRLIEQLDEACA